MQTIRIEGLIIQSVKFQDFDQILEIFTTHSGILKLIVKGAFSKKQGKGAMTSPLVRAEFIYLPRKGEIHACREISLLNSHLKLRERLEVLEASIEMLKAIHETQLPNKPAPDLYQLLIRYLEKMPLVSDPYALAASFRLKLLRHEGFLGLSNQCTSCGIPLSTLHIVEGESFCRSHAPHHHLEFDKDEAPLLFHLALCRSFTELSKTQVNPEFRHKVLQLFQSFIEPFPM